MSAINIILSIFLGLIPETLFFTLFLSYSKNIKEKRLKLFLLITIAYTLCIMIIRFKIGFYIAFMILLYLILKLLYKDKTQIIDFFVINIGFIYVCFVSFICFLVVGENLTLYYIMAVVDKILLFVPFIFRKKLNLFYNKYCELWNRNYNKKQPIKSITLRNISLISLNVFIFICDAVCLYILMLAR